MAWAGLALLVLVGVGIVATGLPAAIILIAVATSGAILGVVTGTIDVAILGVLPARLINLFESDLLQALPLYVTMGLLLDACSWTGFRSRTRSTAPAMRRCRARPRRRWCRA
jgi:TRAP-type mannitol/chloroaromatic compound transport system permease large subunit